ncbi:MAG: dihydropteroate synthase [Bacteroidota bacterium]
MDQPKVMGVLNFSPDSFFEGSRIATDEKSVLKRVEKMLEEGADILDVGGYSSRPHAEHIPVEEEIRRVVPAIAAIKKNFGEVIISIDTFRAAVVQAAVEMGAAMVNDISAGNLDESMLPTVAKLGVPYLAMHMRGNPQTMQEQTEYEDLIPDILNYFASKIEQFQKFGIKDILVDPGFGFAKTREQNFDLLRNLRSFRQLGFPVVVGVSRKSMIYKTLNLSPSEALNGTTALHMYALVQGAQILRVHDVKEAKETIQLFQQLAP